MKSDTPLDYAVFQLSPRLSRCELFVSSNGNTEKLASGLFKPFVTHLKVAEEQVALAVQSIKLEGNRYKNAESWFTKGTLERFVRFVSTPEVLELVNTFDAEMSQLESARKIYSQGVGEQPLLGADGPGSTSAADATKKELLRAIDVRLVAVRQDLTAACSRASAAGFNPDSVSELLLFAERFGALRLSEACGKFIALCQRRPDLFSWGPGVDDRALRSSSGSDMSLDDQTDDHDHNGSHQTDSNKSKPSTFQQQQPKSLSSSITFPLRRALRESSVESDDSGTSSKEQTETTSETTKKDEESPSIAATQPVRRLSVQDRINMFENKQKENSGSSGGKLVVGKSAELRRLSSDVSSAPAVVEKAVLRRWSGVSDMSISVDLSGDKKEIESSESTPTPTSASIHAKVGAFAASSGDKDRKGSGFRDSGSTSQIEQLGAESKLTSSMGKVENVSLKDQSSTVTWSDSLSSRTVDMDLKGQASSQPQFKSFSGEEELFDSRYQVPFQAQVKISSGGAERRKSKDQTSSETQLKAPVESAEVGVSAKSSGDIFDGGSNQNKVENVGVRDKFVPKSRFKSPLPKAEDIMSSGKESIGTGTKKREASLPQPKVVESGTRLPQWRSPVGEVEEVGRKDLDEMLPFSSSTKVEDSGLHGMKLQQQSSVDVKKLQIRRDDSSSFTKNKTALPVTESKDIFNVTAAASTEQSQWVRQSKGNQELNDELQMKANELEKLFAEHKLRVPSDQSVTSRRGKPVDVQVEVFAGSENKKEAADGIRAQIPADGIRAQIPDEITIAETFGSSSSASRLNAGSQRGLVYNLDHGSNMKQSYSELGLSDDFRGKFYDKYMQKRDAKLKEEWDSKRAEKEAKLKAMHDSLERSRAEMKAKFSGSAGRQNSAQSARRRAEKLRSFNNHPPVKREEFVDFLQSGEDEDLSKFPESKPYSQDRMFGETSLGDGSSSSNPNKVLPSRNISSATPRTPAAPASRSAAKTSNAGSGRRRMQSENPLAQSVPNFSDLKKENMKPSSGGSKSTTRSRHYVRSKSSGEDARVKEEKLRRPQSLRKISAGPVESKDVSTPNSDGVVLAPLKFDREQTEPGANDKLPKILESKTFLRKGNGIGPGAGAGIAKLKASIVSETVKNEEESDESAFEPEEAADKQVEEGEEEEEEEEFESVAAEDFDNVDNGNPRLSQESGNSGSENRGTLRSHSHVDSTLEAELPAALPLTYHSVGPVQESPGESPVSWNSHMHHSFSYPQETSDVDASADSPIGSPASWNSHSLAQTEADAARMRKKWGSAQKPILMSNTCQNPSRKDVTKGFKRLLKFGRKNRGTESLVDWISATTSEGDDDTEDGRDPANRSSEDLRKSRMGFSQSHRSDDGFNDSELFGEQVQALNSSIPAPPANFKLRDDQLSGSSIKAPRSFFSLSSFRSKGNDSKPR